jgi:predicted kinase
MARVLYIIRGVPGAGKSTLAEKLTVYNYAADDYFGATGRQWDKESLKASHDWCKRQVELAMTHEVEEIAVNNTFTRKWEYDPYVKLAEQHGYKVVEIIVKSDFMSVHHVPQEKVEEMRKRFEYV